ncbi:MAG: hypothetical protein M0R47_06760 [Methylobacter sp.]|jgi:hypothetical protein|uniref:hypothetical protein n=1 Tax=Methylobacter sp. TaxID=2051955 RepID=UPI0025FD3FE9|nr:hypothetical protein [Methylobacter sp.]MCK9620222.1 hypothetical protein [Methylobacter sp.]
MNSAVSLSDRNRLLAVMVASLFMAILFGLVSTTANLILISFTVALFVGGFLLSRPIWIVWIVLSSGLLVLGIIPIYDDSLDSKAGWAISLLCFILLSLAFFKSFTTPDARKDTPSFIWLLLVFFVYAVLNSFIQCYSAEEFIGGFKRYFQLWGVLFALCWIAFDERHIRVWRKFFLIVALVQLPFVVYELITLVPLREGMIDSFPGMVPIDVVAGTFGSSIYGGGNSGEMSTFLVIVLAFLLSQRMHRTLSVGRFVLLIPWVLAPLFLGETKVVIVMLPLSFLVLYRRELLARPHYGLVGLMAGSLLTVCMGYAYMSISKMSMDELITDTLRYNVYETGYGSKLLNRTTVLTFWANQQGAHDPVSFVFGNGLGSAHQNMEGQGGQGGHIESRYPYYGIGLTGASTLLWETGVFGCGLLIAVFARAWFIAGRLYRESVNPIVRADANAIQAALSLFVFHLFYNSSLLEAVSFQIVFAAVLGYLAWLYRRHVDSMMRNST